MPLINRCGGGSAELQVKSKDITDPSYPYVDVTPDNGYDGLSKATVYARLIERTVTPSILPQTVYPYSGYVGLSKVNIEAVPYWVSQHTSNTDITSGDFTSTKLTINAPTNITPTYIVVAQNYGNKSSDNAIAVLEFAIESRGDNSYSLFVYGYTQGGYFISENAVSTFNNDFISTDHFQLINDGNESWRIQSVGSGFYPFDTSKQHHVFVMYQ